jgi:hypothetical protein
MLEEFSKRLKGGRIATQAPHEQRPQRFGPLPEAELRPDVSGGDDPPRDETECSSLAP